MDAARCFEQPIYFCGHARWVTNLWLEAHSMYIKDKSAYGTSWVMVYIYMVPMRHQSDLEILDFCQLTAPASSRAVIVQILLIWCCSCTWRKSTKSSTFSRFFWIRFVSLPISEIWTITARHLIQGNAVCHCHHLILFCLWTGTVYMCDSGTLCCGSCEASKRWRPPGTTGWHASWASLAMINHRPLSILCISYFHHFLEIDEWSIFDEMFLSYYLKCHVTYIWVKSGSLYYGASFGDLGMYVFPRSPPSVTL